MTPEDSLLIAGAVVILTQLAKWAGVSARFGPLVVLLVSALGIGVWKADNAATVTWFSLFIGFINVAASAAGVFGFTRSAADSLTATRSDLQRGLLVLLIAGLAASGAACASARGPLLAADRSIHASLAAVQDTANTLCDAAVIAPDPCRGFNRDLVPALEAGDAFNRAVRAERVGELGALLQAVGRLTAAINTYMPETQRQRLLDLLANAVSLGFQGAR